MSFKFLKRFIMWCYIYMIFCVFLFKRWICVTNIILILCIWFYRLLCSIHILCFTIFTFIFLLVRKIGILFSIFLSVWIWILLTFNNAWRYNNIFKRIIKITFMILFIKTIILFSKFWNFIGFSKQIILFAYFFTLPHILFFFTHSFFQNLFNWSRSNFFMW